MRPKSKWEVKKLILKNEVICEYEFQALQVIGKEILEGRFKIELEKVELKIKSQKVEL